MLPSQALRRLKQLLAGPKQLDFDCVLVQSRDGSQLFHGVAIHFLEQDQATVLLGNLRTRVSGLVASAGSRSTR